MRRFAEKTGVPARKSLDEIERLVRKHGASSFVSGWEEGGAATVAFGLKGRLVRFRLQPPPTRGSSQQKFDQETRRRWRCLLLAIKAKLEVVESGIATFEEEFLAHVVMADDVTIWERIQMLEKEGRPMLPPIGGTPK